jgi:hypothetical protein
MATSIGSTGITFGDSTTQNTAAILFGIEYQTISAVNVQTFNSSGTWTKPASGTIALIECWGGGGSGARRSTRAYTGGGGGGYVSSYVSLSTLPSSVSVTVGAGGAARSGSNQNGAPGGNTYFDTILYVTGGQGGVQSDAGGSGGTIGLYPSNVRSGLTESWPSLLGLGDAQIGGASLVSKVRSIPGETRDYQDGTETGIFQYLVDPSILWYEIGGISNNYDGSIAANGTNTVRSGAGGGGTILSITTALMPPGTSTYGGNGGAGGTTGTAGTQPGGGGGGATSTSGAGGAGRVKVTVF